MIADFSWGLAPNRAFPALAMHPDPLSGEKRQPAFLEHTNLIGGPDGTFEAMAEATQRLDINAIYDAAQDMVEDHDSETEFELYLMRSCAVLSCLHLATGCSDIPTPADLARRPDRTATFLAPRAGTAHARLALQAGIAEDAARFSTILQTIYPTLWGKIRLENPVLSAT